ncbi:voltage-dependent T-type calcium channel subunit alpha-1I-like [Cyprinodon tularosa]|uniref:voltage-dependent T-type calcium channel subunit alpha-1I-like n=1 Tax=Cyprinodon tularosa TaxID=77115 RepID=UPI0018E21642|nr:voltage-dependent T-type calcium channel subunit alpha-1I-like [Cyprinodon tularosa]
MYDGVDAVGIDQQPVTNYNNWRIIFFVTFILLSLILQNMFTGVMVESYSRCQRGRHQLDDHGNVEQGADRGVDQTLWAKRPPFYRRQKYCSSWLENNPAENGPGGKS